MSVEERGLDGKVTESVCDETETYYCDCEERVNSMNNVHLNSSYKHY